MLKNVILLILFLLCYSTYCQSSNWTIVYQNDKNGKVLQGDLGLLRSAIRQGYPIRVGWGSQSDSDPNISVEHVVDASFITILGQKHVQAQIRPIFGQRPSFDEELIRFRDNFWFMIANTNGKSTTATRNLNTGEIEGEKVSNRKFTWYVNAPIDKLKAVTDAIF